VLNHFAPLIILSGAGQSGAPAQAQALAALFIRLRTIGLDIALVFFGFHCLIAGGLIVRSTFLPRILGLLLAIGGVGYIANISAAFLPPAIAPRIFPYIMLPAGLAEIVLALWLLIFAVNTAKWRQQAGLPETLG
jgi:hypothetical protein